MSSVIEVHSPLGINPVVIDSFSSVSYQIFWVCSVQPICLEITIMYFLEVCFKSVDL